MSHFCRVTLTADPLSWAAADDVFAWLGSALPAASVPAAAGAIQFDALPGGLVFCGSAEAVEALLAQVRPSLHRLGIMVAEKLWARDVSFVDIMGRISYRAAGEANPYLAPCSHIGRPITFH